MKSEEEVKAAFVDAESKFVFFQLQLDCLEILNRSSSNDENFPECFVQTQAGENQGIIMGC